MDSTRQLIVFSFFLFKLSLIISSVYLYHFALLSVTVNYFQGHGEPNGKCGVIFFSCKYIHIFRGESVNIVTIINMYRMKALQGIQWFRLLF